MLVCIYDVALGTRAFTKSLNHHLKRTFFAPIEEDSSIEKIFDFVDTNLNSKYSET